MKTTLNVVNHELRGVGISKSGIIETWRHPEID